MELHGCVLTVPGQVYLFVHCVFCHFFPVGLTKGFMVLVVVQCPFNELVSVSNIIIIVQVDQGAFLVMVENTFKFVGNLLQILQPLGLEEL